MTSILLALLLKSISPEDPIAFAHLLAFTVALFASFLSQKQKKPHRLHFQVGVLLFLLGFFRFGFLDNILSQPLLAGTSFILPPKKIQII